MPPLTIDQVAELLEKLATGNAMRFVSPKAAAMVRTMNKLVSLVIGETGPDSLTPYKSNNSVMLDLCTGLEHVFHVIEEKGSEGSFLLLP